MRQVDIVNFMWGGKKRNLSEALPAKTRQNIGYDLTIKIIKLPSPLFSREHGKRCGGVGPVSPDCAFLLNSNITLFIRLLMTADYQPINIHAGSDGL